MGTDNSANKDLQALAKDDFEFFEMRFSEGDDIAILRAMFYAGATHMTPPRWATTALGNRLAAFDLNPSSLDNIFKFKKNKLSKLEQRTRLYGKYIYKRIELERAKGVSNNEELWTQIGAECKHAFSNTISKKEYLGAHTVRDIYFEMVKMAETKNIPINK